MNQAGKDRKAKRKGTSKISTHRRGHHLALLKFYGLESSTTSSGQPVSEGERIALARAMAKAQRPQERRRNVEAA